MIRNLTLTLSATGSLFFMSSLAGAQESSLEEQLDVVLAPELDLSAISESAISPAVPVVTPPVVKVDLSKQQAKQIEVPELEKIPEAELPPLLKSKTIKAQKAEKAETDDAGVLSGLLPWKKSDEIAPEDADGTPAPISSPAPEIIESATSAAPDVTAAIEKVKTAETQAASFTAALALAVGGEENLPTVADPVSTLPEQIDVGGEENKIGGFFSGVGNVFSRDDKGDKIEGTACRCRSCSAHLCSNHLRGKPCRVCRRKVRFLGRNREQIQT